LSENNEAAVMANPAVKQAAADESTERVDRLGSEKVSKLLIEFAIPAIIGMICNGLYNIIDGIFMGHGVGAVGLATATVSMPVMAFSMAVSNWFGTGGNALVALRLGEGRKDQAERILGVCFTLVVIAGILCTVLIHIFMMPLLRLSGATEEIIPSCETFIRIVSFGVPMQFLGMGFNNYIRTAGAPTRALLTMVVGVVVSTIFNAVLVLGMKLGVAGSAWATILGQLSSCLMVLHYFWRSKKAPFKLRASNLGFDLDIVGKVLTLGSAAFIMQISNSFIQLFVNNSVGHFGAMAPIGAGGAFAAMGVVGRISGLTFWPIMGCSVAAQPLFGYNYGAKNFKRVKETYFTAFKGMVIMGTAVWLVIRLFAEPIATVFGVSGDLLEFTSHVLRVQTLLMPISGIQMLTGNYFQSSGQPFKSLILSASRQGLFTVPLMILLPRVLPLIFPTMYGLDGLYYAYPTADTLAVILAATVIRIEFKRLTRVMEGIEADKLAASGVVLPTEVEAG